MSISVFATGLATGFGLILAIGAQNTFVIKQGLLRRHIFVVATICSLCDAALITLGVSGVGAIIASSAWLTGIATWGGGAFLIWFGARALYNALRHDHFGLAAAEAEAGAGSNSLRNVVVAAFALSLLNPHVYLDTVVLMGGIGAQYAADDRWVFAAGGVTASFLFFYGIAFGASLLTPLFRNPLATRTLDGVVALVMFTIAFLLLTGQMGSNGISATQTQQTAGVLLDH